MNIRDPIYDYIDVEEEFEDIVNSPYFLRLNNIKQNSLLYYVYPSAKHDRLCHCLGTYHLMKQTLNNKYIKLSENEKYNLKAAALLHDVGHGPYSHLWEQIDMNFDHEKISAEIIKKIFKIPKAAKIIEKKSKHYELISSVIDVDKLDYMSRDSYFTGVGYGKTDVDRITKNIFFQDNKLCINPKVIPTVEHLIIGRNLLYRSTYFHRKVRAMDMNLSKIFARAKELYLDNKDLFIDELLAKSFEGKLKLDDFLLTNDSLIEFHLLKWKNSNDSILKDLVKRFYLRDKGFTAISKSWINIKKSDALNEIKKSFDEHYYFKEDIIKKTVYESEVYVKKYNNALVPLSKFSEIIKRVKDFDIHEEFIIGPSEIIKKNKGL